MESQLSASCRVRPIRIAFLVENAEHQELVLDGIFADCYSRWGGRFSLIVPCADGVISSAYWPWLEVYDPDILYSYVDLQEKSVLEIHERLGPAEYIQHKLGPTPRLDVHGFKPQYRFDPLSSLSTAFRRARYSSNAPISVIDSWYSESPSRFLTDNLGIYHWSYSTGIFPTDALPYVCPLTVLSCNKDGSKRQGVPSDLQAVTSEAMAFAVFGAGKATSLSLLSASDCPRMETRDHRWSSSFNLVVGNSFADRIIFWNLRLLIPRWLDGDLCCLRIDADQLNDVDFSSQLAAAINKRNHVNDGTGGSSRVTLRSASHTAEQLDDIAKKIRSAKCWSALHVEAPLTLEQVVPNDKALDSETYFIRDIFSPPNASGWTSFRWTPPTVRPPQIEPDHISDAPLRQSFVSGCWACDFIFECEGTSVLLGQENRWSMSKRWRMASAFRPSFVASQTGFLPPRLRRSNHSCITIYVNNGYPIDTIEVPTAREAFASALSLDGRSPRDLEPGEHAQVRPGPKVSWTRESNEDRYLTGVLGMVGGLYNAQRRLLHPFMKEIFAKLGGAPNLADSDLSETVNRLKNNYRGNPVFDLTNESDTTALGYLIVKAALSAKAPMSYISLQELRDKWKTYRERYWSGHAHEKKGSSDDLDWDKLEANSLDQCLIDLRARQILFQGHPWTCAKCHHRNWIDFSSMSLELTCGVCKHVAPAPVDIPWQFRPNPFLIDSLRSHSVLSLIWVLSELRDRARFSFLYAGPTCLGYSLDREKPDQEVDLLAVLDGQAIMCEVKSAWRSLRPSDIDKLVATAKRLRPDIAILAVMESGNNQKQKLLDATADLANDGIKLQLLTPDDCQTRDDPYLNYQIY